MELNLQLRNQFFDTIELKRNITTETQIELETRYDYSVNYADDAKSCLAKLTCEIRSKDNPELLYVKLVNLGIFDGDGLDTDEGKLEAHIECNRILFPYTQYMVASLAVHAGFPPIYIQNQTVKKENVIIN